MNINIDIKNDNIRIFSCKAVASVINDASLTDPFSFEKKDQYVPVSKEKELKEGKLSNEFPPHSYTQIKIEIGRKD